MYIYREYCLYIGPISELSNVENVHLTIYNKFTYQNHPFKANGESQILHHGSIR